MNQDHSDYCKSLFYIVLDLGRYSEIAFQAGFLRSPHRLELGSASPIRATSPAGEKRLWKCFYGILLAFDSGSTIVAVVYFLTFCIDFDFLYVIYLSLLYFRIDDSSWFMTWMIY